MLAMAMAEAERKLEAVRSRLDEDKAEGVPLLSLWFGIDVILKGESG